MVLNDENIRFIREELEIRGLIYEPLKNEILDHFCDLVEDEMQTGKKFKEAFDIALKQFGKGQKLRELQRDTIKAENFNTIAMFKNYFTTGLRNLSKYKFYSFTNIIGLSLGISAVILIAMYIHFETSFDKHFEDSERIYRVTSDHLFDGQTFHAAVTPAPLASTLMMEYPDVESATRFNKWGSEVFKVGENSFKEEGIVYADSNLFEVLDLGLIEGNPETILRRPNGMLISESTAEKYFGSTSPIDQIIQDNNGREYVIEGVFRDLPKNTHFNTNIIASMSGSNGANSDMWLSNNFVTYVKLLEGTDWKEFESKFDELIIKYVGPQLKSFTNLSIEEAKKQGMSARFYLLPLEEIHLESDTLYELGVNGNKMYVYIFFSVAVFILILACINFMNLATARSFTRAKEVGVRKVLGSLQSHLIKQFLAESFLVVLISYLLGLLIARVMLPMFNTISGLSLELPLGNLMFIFLSIIGISVVSLIAGSYPAFYLSSFKPTTVIGGKVKSGSGKSWIRSGLVVFQFAVSIFLISGTLIVNNQLKYIQNKNLGFNKDELLLVQDSYLLGSNFEVFRNELQENPLVESVSFSSFLPTTSARSDNTYFPEDAHDLESAINMQTWGVDQNYIDAFGIEVINGNNFNPESGTMDLSVILNEEAAKELPYDNPVGRKLGTFYYDYRSGQVNTDSIIYYTIIGVIRNFHFSSLKSTIGPLGLFYRQGGGMYSGIKFKSQNTEEVINLVEEKWKKIAVNQPFSYSFLDDRFNDMYRSEVRTGEIFASFATLAVIIACLGLFALSAYTVERRTKEIGIRKVMGASNATIVLMLSKEFGILISIAIILAIPATYFGSDFWLSSFAYKRNLGVSDYLIPGLLALIVAGITMSYQSIRAARSNPATSLRSE